ncbi:transcriptional regulator GlxA family with amidase domain [Arthrobacter pigmenti]|uniref:Transcriptional regulator GlxA family with amidase domain n=1 Tax=Arthrobacter pigmenti TaxID=271432 RepID=A0A846RDK2_9MICC|nr:helix-turn-helix domain-containing protein [Arthrobacter pigmenti]NJC21083.1 transcriptional regulator GlxA family with amidase domain [Arthrobacter pigmenti]
MICSVAAIVLPPVAAFEFGVACEVFGIDRSDRQDGVPKFDFRVCTPKPGLLPGKTGFSLQVTEDLSATETADLVIMLPYSVNSPCQPEVHQALRAAHERGAWVLSVCSGAFALAEAGLLNGRRAATHWMYSQQLAKQYPEVSVDENVLYVQDGNIITSAGTAAGIDACLHLIRTELGAAAATSIARSMVVPPHRAGGQAQYIDRPISVSECDTLEDVLVWMDTHLSEEHSVSALAARAHMSERTFARRFKAETGTTPAAWLAAQRVLRAQGLLEETDLSIEAIARETGFGQAVLLRHHFQRTLGTSPAAYRRTFRGVTPATELTTV